MDFKALRAFRVGGTYGTCALLAELRAGKMNSTSLARSVLVQKRFWIVTTPQPDVPLVSIATTFVRYGQFGSRLGFPDEPSSY